MNKKVLPAAVAAICAIGAVNYEASATDKAKNQKLGDLSCLTNQIAEFDGDLWTCIDTPSGGESGAHEYQFVDADGAILGDVVYIEDGFTAWGYINDLSTTSTIQVTASFNKSGRSGTYLAGNVKSTRVWYESSDCSGSGYLADYEIGLSFRTQYGGTVPYPPYLAFLETEPVYYLPDIWNAQASTWTEVILGSVTGVYDFQSYNFTSDITNCGLYSFSVSATQIDSFGIPIDAPVMPISVVKK